MKKVLSVFAVLAVAMVCVFSQGTKESAVTQNENQTDAQSVQQGEERTLTVYAYDTFCGDWGAAGSIIPAFEEKTGIKVNLVAAGNASEVLNKVMLEGDKTQCDVIVGISDDMAEKAYPILQSYQSPYLETIDPKYIFDTENRLIPYDYGIFGFVIDNTANLPIPESLSDLTKEQYIDKVILIDPRGGSAVGLGLMMWTKNVLGDGWTDWWKTMSENALTMTSGWSAAWGLFTEGEAPIVISYTSSTIYDETGTQTALIFDHGHEATIEAAGIVKSTKHLSEAQEFIDFLITDGQLDLGIANAMYPVNSTIELPASYDNAPKPDEIFLNSDTQVSQALEELTNAVWR